MADLKNIEEIRGRDTRELRLELQEHRKELFQLRFHGAAEAVAKSSRYREIRRTVARILTIIGERERGAEVVPATAPAKLPKRLRTETGAAQPAKAAKPAAAAPTSKPAKAKATKAAAATKPEAAQASKPETGKAGKRSAKQ